jgi:hypothetical protein
MKHITLAAWVLLIPLVAAVTWYWVINPAHYFPGRYEDAFLGTAIALLVAALDYYFCSSGSATLQACGCDARMPNSRSSGRLRGVS